MNLWLLFQFQKFQALIKDWPADLYTVSPIISAVQVRKYVTDTDMYPIRCFDMSCAVFWRDSRANQDTNNE